MAILMPKYPCLKSYCTTMHIYSINMRKMEESRFDHRGNVFRCPCIVACSYIIFKRVLPCIVNRFLIYRFGLNLRRKRTTSLMLSSFYTEAFVFAHVLLFILQVLFASGIIFRIIHWPGIFRILFFLSVFVLFYALLFLQIGLHNIVCDSRRECPP